MQPKKDITKVIKIRKGKPKFSQKTIAVKLVKIVERPIMTICGSTRFRDEIKEFSWNQTKEGWLVLFPPFAKEEIDELEKYRKELEIQHFQKITMAKKVVIYNKDQYIGDSTTKETAFAYFIGKEVESIEEVTDEQLDKIWKWVDLISKKSKKFHMRGTLDELREIDYNKVLGDE